MRNITYRINVLFRQAYNYMKVGFSTRKSLNRNYMFLLVFSHTFLQVFLEMTI